VQEFKDSGLKVEIVSDKLGDIGTLPIAHTFLTTDPVLFDAIYVASMSDDKKFKKQSDRYVTEAFNHFKTIGASLNEVSILEAKKGNPGVVNSGEVPAFVDAVTAYRHWNRDV